MTVALPAEFECRSSCIDGRYRRIAALAHGGLGQVWLAHDVVLDRRVAVKQILAADQATYAAAAARFARELRLSARLQHPAIIVIHDGGVERDGEPYYVMKHIAGSDVGFALAHCRTLAERLALLPALMTACEGLAYAHAQDIVHRDVKPGNIVLGPFAETVVIDWGLAKDLRLAAPGLMPGGTATRTSMELVKTEDTDVVRKTSAVALGSNPGDGELTQLGEVIGTPAYMSPEQARGDEVDARTDVFAFGAILHQVVTGALPRPSLCERESALAAAICEPIPTLLGLRDVAPELLTIINRATAVAPKDRYPDCGALAADLRAFLQGALVASHAYSWRQRLMRLARRFRHALFVFAGACIVLGVTSLMGVNRIVHERNRAQAAQHVSELSRRSATLVMDFVLREMTRDLAAVGKLAMLEQPALHVVAYYVSQPLQTFEDLMNQALALSTLAEVELLRDATGRAEGYLARSMTLLHEATVLATDGTRVLPLVARVQRQLARVAALTGHSRALLAHSRASKQILLRGRAWPLRFEPSVTDVVLAHRQLASALRATNQLTDAEHELENGVALLRPPVSANGSLADDSELEMLRASLHAIAGDVLTEKQDGRGALAAYQHSAAIHDTICAREPWHIQYQRECALLTSKLAGALAKSGDVRGAHTSYLRGVEQTRRLVAHDPSNRKWQLQLSWVLNSVADIEIQLQQNDRAIIHYQEALRLRESALAVDPRNIERLDMTATTLGQLANAYALGDPGAALPLAQRAVTLYARIAEIDEQHGLAHDAWASALGNLAVFLDQTNRRREALAALHQALTINQRLRAAMPDEPRWKISAIYHLVNLADMQTGPRASLQAQTYLRDALALCDALVLRDPTNVDRQHERDVVSARLRELR